MFKPYRTMILRHRPKFPTSKTDDEDDEDDVSLYWGKIRSYSPLYISKLEREFVNHRPHRPSVVKHRPNIVLTSS